MRIGWGMLVSMALVATGLVAGAAASADDTADDTADQAIDQTIQTTDTTSSAPPASLDAPATVDETPVRSMQVVEPGVAESPAERAGEAIQLTEPPPAPTTTTTTTTTLPPLDQLPANSGIGRRIVYSKSNQWVWLVTGDDVVEKKHAVSGRRTWNQPLPGEYSVFSRSQYTCNIKNPSLCWRYMVRFTVGPEGDNIGFHEIPTDTSTGNAVQGEWQLGQPLSAGCIRQATPDALYVWNWAPVGTKVVVLP
jgi:lipoprotein-anchoring transpeptidase ErfK/SrfK